MQVEVDFYKPKQESVATPESSVTVTDAAAKQVRTLLDQLDDGSIGLRIRVQGGGCSGFQYVFEHAKEADEWDIVIPHNNIKVIIDKKSYIYLAGSVIDFKVEVAGAFFDISNPNVTAACGCGVSFSL